MAVQPATGPAPAVEVSAPARPEYVGVRLALAAAWADPTIPDVADDALLAELYPPSFGDFDSLAKAETIVALVDELGLPEDVLRAGSAETALALGGSIGDLERYIAVHA